MTLWLVGLSECGVVHICSRVGDVMTEAPLVVRPGTDMTSAARMLLDSRVRTPYTCQCWTLCGAPATPYGTLACDGVLSGHCSACQCCQRYFVFVFLAT